MAQSVLVPVTAGLLLIVFGVMMTFEDPTALAAHSKHKQNWGAVDFTRSSWLFSLR